MENHFHPAAAKDARDVETQYAEESQELADRFWPELNGSVDEVFLYP